MTLYSKDDVRDLVILFSVTSAGIMFYYIHKFISWSAGSDYHSTCGQGRPGGPRCGADFLEIASELLEIWAISVTVTVLPLLTLVTALVILVRWIRSLGETAKKH